MSDTHKAVFLSYASQDAEAAKRICEALRTAGVEVWFDQSELVGGDQWDAKIRGQIGSCALFVPVISANTQARLEGYFRIEWKLAAQRTYAMADEKTFLLPVLIDATRDGDAKVPAEFRAVQWTKLPGGETSPAFCARVQKLLGGESSEGRGQKTEIRTRDEAVVSPKITNRRWLAPGLLAVLVGTALLIWQPWRKAEKPAVAPSPAALSPGATELARVRAQLTPDRWQREDFAAMAPTLDRLINANPELADAWAMRSIINSLQVLRNYDSSTKPLEVGKAAADRAMRLAPGSPLADIATGMHLVAMTSRGGDARACRPYLDRGVAALPPDALTHYAQLASFWFAYDFDQVQRLGEEWRALDPQASFPPWIFAQLNVVRRRPSEAEKWADIAQVDPNITGVRAFFTAFESKYYLRADLPAAWSVLQKVPAAGRSVHRVVHARWLVAMADHRWDEALQELAQVPETFLFDRAYHGPKGLLAGLAHQRAGRPEAAAAQFREAERLLREHLAADADNEELHLVLAVVLACAGRGAEARSELALVEPLVKGRTPSIYRGSLVLTMAQAYAVLGDYRQLAPWLRKLFAEPSQFPFTPASVRIDPRFADATGAPDIQALLKEFAALDQPVATPFSLSPSPSTRSLVDSKSVAVLAFANLSDDKGNEYFSDGISEELLNVLAKVPGLKVSARTSAFYFKGKEVPIPEIAKQLGVAYVVEGSVRKQGDKVRITAQLIKADGGFHVWSDTFTRDLKDIFAVQDEIAGLIAQNLQLKLGASAPGAKSAVNPEAFELYVEARQAWNLRTLAGFDRAEELLNQALALEPGFARAHAALSDVWATRGQLRDEISQFGQRESPLMRRILAAAERAVALDPNSAEAHASLGNAYTISWRLAEATRTLRHAVALNPNYASAHQFLGRMLLTQGYFDEAAAELARAVELDPLSHRIIDNYAIALFAMGRPTEALAAAERALALRPDSVQAAIWRARCLSKLGRHEEAVAQARRVKDAGDTQSVYLVEVFAAAGLKSEAEAMLAQPDRNFGGRRFTGLLELGRRDEALAAMNPAEMSSQSLYQSNLDPIRDDPQFKQVLATLGLTEADARMRAWSKAHPTEMPEAKK